MKLQVNIRFNNGKILPAVLAKFVCMSMLCGFASCHQTHEKENTENPSHTLFQQLAPSQTHIDFSNNLTYDAKFNIYTYRNFYNGGGVAIGDINNDGLPDVFFCSSQYAF